MGPTRPAALADTTSPKWGEKATYYSAVCLETGQTERLNVTETLTAETTVTFLKPVRDPPPQPLIVNWDNGPMHRGEALRTYLTTPDLQLRLVALPAYSPDLNGDEAIWDWMGEDVTANPCFGTAAKVGEKVDAFLAGLTERGVEAQQRCQSILPARTDALLAASVRWATVKPHVALTFISV